MSRRISDPYFERRWTESRPDWGLATFLAQLYCGTYALLMGAIALFIVLVIVMYVTRKVDWYARDAG